MARRLKVLLNEVQYVGIITFELFEAKSELLVNEVAPRVHNSAHWTQDGLVEDQFLLHLKAGLDLPLKKPKYLAPAFAMTNLLGSRWNLKTLKHWPLSAKLHWYGKAESRPGRKMGHINALGKTPNEALKLALAARKEMQ